MYGLIVEFINCHTFLGVGRTGMLLHGVVIVGKIFLWKIKGFVMAGKIRKKIASIICVLVPFRNMRSNVRKFIEQPNVLERIGRARQAREMWRRERVLAAGG